MAEPSRLSELDTIQNPALGSYALWRFGLGYQNSRSEPPSFLAGFLVLPAVLHLETLELVSGTMPQSGLGLFVAKLGANRDLLVSFHERALRLRPLTIGSMAVGVQARLLKIDYAGGVVRSNHSSLARASRFSTERVRQIGAASEKLGTWIGRAGFPQAAAALRVDF